jgi:ATP-binding cassette subfamily C (CFTR/MRP) protein 1
MNNVERIQHYIDLETEAEPKLPTDPKDDELWPTAGKIDFENAKLQYRPDLPLVLKGLDFSIRAGEKVGIIGRTGAGKSSVAQALFRTVELCEGKISVDGRDLRGLGLETVSYIQEEDINADLFSFVRDWRSFRKMLSFSRVLSGKPDLALLRRLP